MECSNGVPGVESTSGDVCCAAACGSCGGKRCVGTGGCCEDYIKDKKVMCEDSGEAPCIIKGGSLGFASMQLDSRVAR